MAEDKVLSCVECGLQFVFSADEQEVHVRRGYGHAPRRCPPCRAEARRRRNPPAPGHVTACVGCGVEIFLPAPPPPGATPRCEACKSSNSKS